MHSKSKLLLEIEFSWGMPAIYCVNYITGIGPTINVCVRRYCNNPVPFNPTILFVQNFFAVNSQAIIIQTRQRADTFCIPYS